jgi:hypothetical protein
VMKPVPPLTFQDQGFTYYLTPYIKEPGTIAYLEVNVMRDETKTTFRQFIGKERFEKSKPI